MSERDLAADMAICEDFKTRTFIPQHMLKGFVDMTENAIRRAQEGAAENLISLLDADDPVEVGCYCTDSGEGLVLCAWCEAKKALAALEGGSGE